MKQEYRDIIHGTINGFLEGNITALKHSISRRLNEMYGVIPQICEVNVFRPYSPMNCNYPVIVASVMIDNQVFTVLRDCQYEAEHSTITDEDAGYV